MTGSQGFPIPDKHYRSSICCWSCSCCFDVGHWYSEETKDFWSAGRHLWFVLRTLGYSSFGSALKFGSFFFPACGHPTSGYCPYYGQSFHQHEPWEGCGVIYTYHQGYGTFLFCCSFCNFPWRGNFFVPVQILRKLLYRFWTLKFIYLLILNGMAVTYCLGRIISSSNCWWCSIGISYWGIL